MKTSLFFVTIFGMATLTKCHEDLSASEQYRYNNSHKMIIDMPEEMPIKGDVLIVKRQVGDTLFIEYKH